MNEFEIFIVGLGLVGVPLFGKKFTWVKPDGNVASIFDRFLLSDSLVEAWNIEKKRIGRRDLTDHTPIWIKVSITNWGPKPFTFFEA